MDEIEEHDDAVEFMFKNNDKQYYRKKNTSPIEIYK